MEFHRALALVFVLLGVAAVAASYVTLTKEAALFVLVLYLVVMPFVYEGLRHVATRVRRPG